MGEISVQTLGCAVSWRARDRLPTLMSWPLRIMQAPGPWLPTFTKSPRVQCAPQIEYGQQRDTGLGREPDLLTPMAAQQRFHRKSPEYFSA